MLKTIAKDFIYSDALATACATASAAALPLCMAAFKDGYNV